MKITLIHLSEDLAQFIHETVQSGRFASEDEALAEAVRLLRRREQEQTDRDGTNGSHDPARQQLENLKRLCQKLDAMPTAAHTDGLTNRDHDRILYVERP
jgi:putative addiction module CopG family antidote